MALPLAMLAACIWPQPRGRMAGLLPLAPIPALLAALFASGGPPLTLPWQLLRASLSLDPVSAVLLGACCFIWITAGLAVRPWFARSGHGEAFPAWWLLTLIGNIGVFVTGDLVSFYLTFSMASLAAYGLIVEAGTPSARRAATVTIALALLSEAFLLMAFVLLAAGTNGRSILIADVVSALPGSPWRDLALALLVAGFGLKMALVPLHVWMPLAYSAAPLPAVAALSGAAVKAGVIGLLRFLPLHAGAPEWGEVLMAAGFLSAFYGVAVGVCQDNPRTVLAYSSISQMGVIAAVLGAGWARADGGTPTLVAFYAAHHVLAKGGLFLAIAALTAVKGPARWWLVLGPAAVLALGLGGLPFSGGALTKIAVKQPLGDGLTAVLANASAVATTILMTHFLARLARTTGIANLDSVRFRNRTDLLLPWLATTVASVAIPWALYPIAQGAGAVSDVLAANVSWSALWPVPLGMGLALAGGWILPRLPRIPAGDIVVGYEAGALASLGLGRMLERGDAVIRQWTAAGLAVLVIMLLLGASFAVTR